MSTPPPSSPDSEHDDDAMLASMGFSSFGAQPRPKKQKISHPHTSSKNASGGNKMPLGKRKPKPALGFGGVGVGRGGVEGVVDVMGGKGPVEGCVDAVDGVAGDRGGGAGDGGEVEEDMVSRDRGYDAEAREKIAVPVEGDGGEGMVLRKEAEDVEEGDKGEKAEGFEGKSWREWRQGVGGEGGVVAFFDWSFVEDPWERLKGGGKWRGMRVLE